MSMGKDRSCLLTKALTIALLATSIKAQQAHYNLGVIVFDNLTPASDLIPEYIKDLSCTLRDNPSLTVKLTNIDRELLSPRSVLHALCNFETEISAIILILPNSNSYKYMPIYKYTVNHISSLGIPLIVWNSYMPNSQVYSSVVQLGPQYDQQAQAHITLLQYYKWYKFSILTTECPGYIEYSSAIRRLVHDTVNEKGEQIMQILSSHTIRDHSIITQLKKLKASDTRVVLLHMTEDELVEVMRAAGREGMDGKEYMWLGTTQVYSKSTFQPNKLPLGIIALTYANKDKSTDEPTQSPLPLTRAMLTTANFWKETITKFNQTRTPDSDPPKMMSCTNANSTEFWRDGQALYNTMIGHAVAAKDITGCGVPQSQKLLTYPVDIDSDGTNKKTSLHFVNLAYSKSKSTKPKKQWKQIGTWYAPNVTELDDITWPGSSPKPPDGKPARSFLRVVTHSELPYVKFTDPNPETGECETIGAVVVRLTEVSEKECPDCRRNKTLFQCATGLCIDLLSKLKEDMQFDYELFQSRDNNWGNYIDDGTGKKQWNGLVRDLMDGYADISMTSLKIGPERNRAIDFSVPFIETGITIIVLIKKGVISATAFLEPYEYTVWVIVCSGLSIGIGINIFLFEWGSPKGLISLDRKSRLQEPYDLITWIAVLVVTVHTVGFVILVFDYLSPPGKERYTKNNWNGERFSLVRSLWLIWTILFGAAVETDNTKGLASRFLTAIWSLFSLVFLASYTANLAAFMITKEEFFELKGINDPKLLYPQHESPPFRFGTVPDGSTAINLKNNYPAMFSYMERFNKKKVMDGIEAVKNNELQAFIYDATVLEFEASQDDDCKLTTVGSWYAMTGYGVGFPKGSKWKEKFDVYLTKYINEGEMDRLRKFWMTGACKKPPYGNGRESSHSLDIVNFTSAYILLIVGVVLAMILLLVEHVYFTFCRRKLRKIDKWGCCSLLSLSMGESLSFEETVMEVIESTRHILCHNDLCKANQQRLAHELDVAICRLNMIHATMRRNNASDVPLAITEGKDVPRKSQVWTKTAKFKEIFPAQENTNDQKERKGEKVQTLHTIHSNEKLEAVVSSL